MTGLLYYTFFHHLIGSGSVGISWINDPKRDDSFHAFVSIVNRKMPLVDGTPYREKHEMSTFFFIVHCLSPFSSQCCECGALGSNATVSLCIRGIYLSLSISLFPFDGEIHVSSFFRGCNCIYVFVHKSTASRTEHFIIKCIILSTCLRFRVPQNRMRSEKNKNMNKKPKQNWKRKRE